MFFCLLLEVEVLILLFCKFELDCIFKGLWLDFGREGCILGGIRGFLGFLFVLVVMWYFVLLFEGVCVFGIVGWFFIEWSVYLLFVDLRLLLFVVVYLIVGVGIVVVGVEEGVVVGCLGVNEGIDISWIKLCGILCLVFKGGWFLCGLVKICKDMYCN